jgi:diadenosine tetraphosphate (Ap4A) HIT family hydrolase
MSGDFELDPRLAANHHVVDWPLCSIFLVNDACYPWLVMVPRRAGIRETYRLAPADRDAFWAEINTASERLAKALQPSKMNIAMLGNMVPQLHAHVIARFVTDPAWPGPVWGIGTRHPYEDEDATIAVGKMRERLGAFS